MRRTVAVVPVQDIADARAFYCDQLGFDFLFEQGTYAGVGLDAVELHLNGYATEGLGSAVVRFEVAGIDEWHATLEAKGLVDPEEPLRTEPWGMRQFGVRDADRNQLMFFTPA